MTTPLTDSGTQRAIDDAAERGAARALEKAGHTPPVGEVPMHRPGDSSETYDICERVVVRSRPAGWVECEKGGPAHRLNDRIKDIESDNKETRQMLNLIHDSMSQQEGAKKSQAKTLTLLVGIMTVVSVAANVIGVGWKIWGHG